jgi:hypothetical protein
MQIVPKKSKVYWPAKTQKKKAAAKQWITL